MKRNKPLEFKKTSQREKKGRLVLLLTGFVLLALIIGAVSLYILWRNNGFNFSRLLGARSAQTSETTVPVSETENTTSGETQLQSDMPVMRVSVLCRDENGKMSFLYVLEADIPGKKVNVVPVTRDTEMLCSGRKMTAGEICSQAGYSFRDSYRETYGKKIDKYIEMNETSFKSIIKTLGSVKVYVEKDVPYDEDGVTYTIRAGLMSMTPDMLLRYMKYAASPEELTRAQAKSAAAVLTTYMTPENVQKGIDLFSEIANLVTTDFTAIEFNDNYDAITEFVSSEPVITSSCP